MNRFIGAGCALAMLLAGCGGSSDEEDDKSGPTAEQKARAIEMSMRMAAATPRIAGERAATPTPGDAAAGTASAGPAASANAARPADPASAPAVQVSAAEAAGCIEKVSRLLGTPAASQLPDFDCAAGTYRGTTPEGQACTLKVAATRGQYRFVQAGPNISIEPDAPAGPFGGRFARYLQPTTEPAATAGPGLRISRTSTAPTMTSETVALYAGPTGTGPARLTRLSYRRVQGTQAFETQCRLEAGPPATRTAAR